MKEMLARWEKLQADAAECALISDRATDKTKRELFAQLSEQLGILALELERVITAQQTGGKIN